MGVVTLSLPEEEAAAMRAAWSFLLGLSSGEVKLDRAAPVRRRARDIVKHFPLGGDLEHAAKSYAPALLGEVEREANQLAQEAAREADRADKAERSAAVAEPTIPPDYLNMP